MTKEMQEITGFIERITFQNGDNGYTVAKLQEPGKRDLTCIVGTLPSIQPGETIRCLGNWKNHPVHGYQFEVSEYHITLPADLTGVEKYLGSGMIKGIGPKYAKRIVNQFGKETLKVIEETPERLKEISGFGKKRIQTITDCWKTQKSIRKVMIFLQGHDVSPTYAQKIFKQYGNESIEILQENPYRLAQDLFGIGFKTADRIAEKLGIEKTSEKRIDSGIEFSLSTLSNEGHVCYPKSLFLEEASQMLEVEPEIIEARLSSLADQERIIMHEMIFEGMPHTFLWLRPLYISEAGIAKELKRIQAGRSQLRSINLKKALDWVQKQLKMELAENQKTAVTKALSEKVLIITGGPGTGKSTITHAILEITEKLTPHILLAAPTGKAAKRMTEITGKKAQTIHSLLEFDFRHGGFKKNQKNPLVCDLIIVDEASMIDTLLMYSFLKAVPDHCRVLFVGDINQLPSVGPGRVLNDLIESKAFSCITLNEIFRQAQNSQIITNAHKINRGQFPEIQNVTQSDFFFIEEGEPEKVLHTIVDLVTRRIPKKFRFHSQEEIQVLAPMRRGIIGTENLNSVLQQSLNPGKEPIFRAGRKLCQGDKVMQIRNNYDKEVFNGDIGKVIAIDHEEQELIVCFDEREIPYDFTEIDELVLAYAISVHKYQGSECPCIVMPVHTSHFKLLYRNLLYTGVTRGKKLVVLIGTKKALALCVKNQEAQLRYTGLKDQLQDRLSLSRIVR